MFDYKKFSDGIGGTHDLKYNRMPWATRSKEKKNSAEIQKILIDNKAEELRELSRETYNTSGIYKRLILYLASMLTFDTIVYPKKLTMNKIDKELQMKLMESCYFIESMNLEATMPKILLTMLRDGVYYGILKTPAPGKIVFQDLPPEFCRTRYVSVNNNPLLEISVAYFDAFIPKGSSSDFIPDFINTFPAEIQKAYRKYKKGKIAHLIDGQYILVSEKSGMAFFFDACKPLMASTILPVEQLSEYKDLEKTLDKQELKKMFYQRLPTDKEGNFLIETDEASAIHDSAVNMLSRNDDIDVFTGVCQAEMMSLSDNTQANRDNLDKMERSLYNDSGITKNLFAADTNLALQYSLANDLALIMFVVNVNFLNFLNYHINDNFSKEKKYYFEVAILPITHYNREQMSDSYLKGAQYGFSKILAGIAYGTKQSNLLTQIELENDIYKLPDIMRPLQSSYTTSNEGGAPPKKDTEKSDKTVLNQEGQ